MNAKEELDVLQDVLEKIEVKKTIPIGKINMIISNSEENELEIIKLSSQPTMPIIKVEIENNELEIINIDHQLIIKVEIYDNGKEILSQRINLDEFDFSKNVIINENILKEKNMKLKKLT